MGGVFSPLPKLKKKMLFKLKHMSFCLFPFLKVRVFCGCFFCVLKNSFESTGPFRSLRSCLFLKKGRSIGVKFSNKIWVHSVGGQHRNTLG